MTKVSTVANVHGAEPNASSVQSVTKDREEVEGVFYDEAAAGHMETNELDIGPLNEAGNGNDQNTSDLAVGVCM